MGRIYTGRCQSGASPSGEPRGNGNCGEEFSLNSREQLEYCNFGCAHQCPGFPSNAVADRVSLVVSRELPDRSRVQVTFALELRHEPVAVGTLLWNAETCEWLRPAARVSAALLRQAECLLQSHGYQVRTGMMKDEECPAAVPGDVAL